MSSKALSSQNSGPNLAPNLELHGQSYHRIGAACEHPPEWGCLVHSLALYLYSLLGPPNHSTPHQTKTAHQKPANNQDQKVLWATKHLWNQPTLDQGCLIPYSISSFQSSLTSKALWATNYPRDLPTHPKGMWATNPLKRSCGLLPSPPFLPFCPLLLVLHAHLLSRVKHAFHQLSRLFPPHVAHVLLPT